jgi:hypothetical protein
MRPILLTLLLAALPGGLVAQYRDGPATTGQATLEGGLFSGAPDALFRLHTDGLAQWGNSGLQASATFGNLGNGETLEDFRLIAFQDIGSRWRYGAELQYTTDAALGGADYALGFRLRYSDAGGTVDSRFALAENGPDGAFSVTVAMRQSLTETARVRGLLHRYSTNPETGDFFAIGLGGEVDVSQRLSGYGEGIWALADDYSAQTISATVGIGAELRPGLRGYAGVTARQTSDTDAQFGLTAGVTLSLDGSGALLVTNPFGQQLAHLGH